MPAFVIIGNPANRRVTMFQEALARQGQPAAQVIAWRDLAEVGAAERLVGAIAGPAILRIDSSGEDDEVDRAFLRRGEVAARAQGYPAIGARELARLRYELGRIVHPRQHHLGFLAVLDELEAALRDRADLRVPQPPPAIRVLFDKAAASAEWRARGIPMPEPLPGGRVTEPDELRARMDAAGWRRVFVKLTSGSSASCVALFARGERVEHLLTTVEDTGKARYNTRRLERLMDRRLIDRVLAFILDEGAHVERAIPKAKLAGRHCDLRVLTIDGETPYVVARTAEHPITNLHLGGQRGDLALLREQVPADAWSAAMASCIAVQRATGAFHVGVDLMFEHGWRAHRVIEGNAFGDLLPNLVADGLDVYGWQIRRLVS